MLTNTNQENIFLMENISNLSVLFNILLNGMITVFIVLSLVFFLGKAIIYFFDSNSDDNELDIEGEINKEIKKMEGVDAKVVMYPQKVDARKNVQTHASPIPCYY